MRHKILHVFVAAKWLMHKLSTGYDVLCMISARILPRDPLQSSQGIPCNPLAGKHVRYPGGSFENILAGITPGNARDPVTGSWRILGDSLEFPVASTVYKVFPLTAALTKLFCVPFHYQIVALFSMICMFQMVDSHLSHIANKLNCTKHPLIFHIANIRGESKYVIENLFSFRYPHASPHTHTCLKLSESCVIVTTNLFYRLAKKKLPLKHFFSH